MEIEAGGEADKMILLVDDDDANREMIGTVLADMGHVVIERADIASTLDFIHKDSPIDLVITDYRLPDSDGLTLTSVVREALPDVPVILMTAYGDVDIYIKSMSLGVYEFLNKPVCARELARVVDLALHKLQCYRSL